MVAVKIERQGLRLIKCWEVDFDVVNDATVDDNQRGRDSQILASLHKNGRTWSK